MQRKQCLEIKRQVLPPGTYKLAEETDQRPGDRKTILKHKKLLLDLCYIIKGMRILFVKVVREGGM